MKIHGGLRQILVSRERTHFENSAEVLIQAVEIKEGSSGKTIIHVLSPNRDLTVFAIDFISYLTVSEFNKAVELTYFSGRDGFIIVS
ncbi:MAG: hypothetical protein ABGF52_10210 [Candidatus Asgardarchaeum sp.]